VDQADGRLSGHNIRLASNLRADFLHFSNYWYFPELANKDEEAEHFSMQSREYSIAPMKDEIEEEIEKLNASLHSHYQFRNTEAVNRLAMLSLIFGAGAVLTGFFGMNFGGLLETIFFRPDSPAPAFHWTAIATVVLLSLGALLFGAYVVVTNWNDYKDILAPRQARRERERMATSLKRGE